MCCVGEGELTAGLGWERRVRGDSSNSLDNVHNTDWTQGNPQSAVKLSGKLASFGMVRETRQHKRKTLDPADFRQLEDDIYLCVYIFIYIFNKAVTSTEHVVTNGRTVNE
jgi:hypothetical protein